jgi:hypothetical protein
MKEGFWLNAIDGTYYEVEDHALWVSNSVNADIMGLSVEAIKGIKKLDAYSDSGRVAIIKIVMEAGWIRVRGHGTEVTFEFTSPAFQSLWAIYSFGNNILGDYSNLFISNLRTKESYETTFKEYKRILTEDGEEAILRLANKGTKLNYRF